MQKGYRFEGQLIRPARSWWPLSERDERRQWQTSSTRPSASTRTRARTRSRRRTASWRASTTLTATQATKRPRKNSRRSQPRLRHPLRPREAQGIRRGGRAFGGFGGAAVTRSARQPLRGRRRPGGSASADFGDILGGIFNRGGGGRAGRSGPRPRPRDRSPARLRPGDQRHADQRHRAEARALHDLSRLRRGTRHLTGHLPALRRPRHRPAEPGLLLDQPALPAMRRGRRDHRGPLPHLRRLRRHPADQALQGQHPRRGQGRHPDPARRQGRGRAARRARPATST